MKRDDTMANDAPQMALVPAPSPTPMQLLDRALQSGVEMDKLEKLMELQERWEAREARKAFDAAVSEAKAKIGPIAKNREGHNSKKYADLAAFSRAADTVLANHGLSYRFRTEQADRIAVTCILAHRDGHFEETKLSGPADATGSKNAIQAIGSTLTYLQRYTLAAALGLSASEDDDGQAAGDDAPINHDDLLTLHAKIDAAQTDAAKLSAYLRIDSLPRLPKSRLGEAHKMLDERMKVLAAKKKAPRP